MKVCTTLHYNHEDVDIHLETYNKSHQTNYTLTYTEYDNILGDTLRNEYILNEIDKLMQLRVDAVLSEKTDMTIKHKLNPQIYSALDSKLKALLKKNEDDAKKHQILLERIELNERREELNELQPQDDIFSKLNEKFERNLEQSNGSGQEHGGALQQAIEKDREQQLAIQSPKDDANNQVQPTYKWSYYRFYSFEKYEKNISNALINISHGGNANSTRKIILTIECDAFYTNLGITKQDVIKNVDKYCNIEFTGSKDFNIRATSYNITPRHMTKLVIILPSQNSIDDNVQKLNKILNIAGITQYPHFIAYHRIEEDGIRKKHAHVHFFTRKFDPSNSKKNPYFNTNNFLLLLKDEYLKEFEELIENEDQILKLDQKELDMKPIPRNSIFFENINDEPNYHLNTENIEEPIINLMDELTKAEEAVIFKYTSNESKDSNDLAEKDQVILTQITQKKRSKYNNIKDIIIKKFIK